jgi:hypothetical protein
MVSAKAASVGESTDKQWITEACGEWTVPNAEPGTTLTIGACGARVSAEGSSVRVSSSGDPVVRDGYEKSDTGYLYAYLQVCDASGACDATEYADWVPPDDVVIDIDAGTARLLGTVEGCAVDVTIVTDSPGSASAGVAPDPNATALTTSRSRDGSANGSVCGSSDVTTEPGTGTISRWESDRYQIGVHDLPPRPPLPRVPFFPGF